MNAWTKEYFWDVTFWEQTVFLIFNNQLKFLKERYFILFHFLKILWALQILRQGSSVDSQWSTYISLNIKRYMKNQGNKSEINNVFCHLPDLKRTQCYSLIIVVIRQKHSKTVTLWHQSKVIKENWGHSFSL